MTILLWILLICALSGAAYIIKTSQRNKQLRYIDNYALPVSINKKLQLLHPQLDEQQTRLVLRALQDYFIICRMAKNKQMVAMPSQVVDDAWHEFILHTRAYARFCQGAMGRFIHHTPTAAMAKPTLAQEGIKRTWRLSCAFEKINPKKPDHLPLIFAIDAQLAIKNGFYYQLNCLQKSSALPGDSYCAGHIACASGCAGDTGAESSSIFDSFSDSDGGSNCATSCGSSCGGD